MAYSSTTANSRTQSDRSDQESSRSNAANSQDIRQRNSPHHANAAQPALQSSQVGGDRASADVASAAMNSAQYAAAYQMSMGMRAAAGGALMRGMAVACVLFFCLFFLDKRRQTCELPNTLQNSPICSDRVLTDVASVALNCAQYVAAYQMSMGRCAASGASMRGM